MLSNPLTSNHIQLGRSSLRSRLPPSLPEESYRLIEAEVDRLGNAAQYGWGHTIDFGPFQVPGLLKDSYLNIAGGFDDLKWWPMDLTGQSVADIGCYTGGLSILMAERNASTVYAVDEIPENLAQCEYLRTLFALNAIKPVLRTVYSLENDIPLASLDLILCSGVLYHLSDMLAGLHLLKRLLKPGGTLLLEGDGVDDFVHSYSNFGRFVGGMWWEPTARCVMDMCEFMGYEKTEVKFYQRDRFIARAFATDREITYRRGINASFQDLRDRQQRSLDPRKMSPAPHTSTSLEP